MIREDEILKSALDDATDWKTVFCTSEPLYYACLRQHRETLAINEER